MTEGRFPCYLPHTINDSIVVSEYIARRLRLKIHDKVTTFFIKEDGPKQRNLIISGIYSIVASILFLGTYSILVYYEEQNSLSEDILLSNISHPIGI